MPRITFEKEVSDAEYEIFHMVLKLEETTSDAFIWNALVNMVVAGLDAATSSSLYNKTGFDDIYHSRSSPPPAEAAGQEEKRR